MGYSAALWPGKRMRVISAEELEAEKEGEG